MRLDGFDRKENPGITPQQQITAQLKSNNTSAGSKHRWVGGTPGEEERIRHLQTATAGELSFL